MTETAGDGIRPWQDFMVPVLQVLSDGSSRKRRELIGLVLDHAGVTGEQRAVVLESGQPKVENRIGWAMSDLTIAGALEKPARATYAITNVGRRLLADHPQGLARTDLEALPAYQAHRPEPRNHSAALTAVSTPDAMLSPVEQIESGVLSIEAEVVTELLTRLRESDPMFFEDAVLTLLLKMGYGGTEQRGRRIGGTGDGGVDGVIDQDLLGLDRIYIQAKRYAEGNNVGREAIQAFVGALQGVGASKGVFITTSDFTATASQYANAVPSRVILIDGQRLGRLMLTHRVGVQVKETYHVVELDEDFFE
ncbi:restriction endonuclease [Sinomonas flava]|uniref:restriction endonuclease n=1 Tax=Sinomonas flava TaxID=496857 RepID=UPI0039A4C412